MKFKVQIMFQVRLWSNNYIVANETTRKIFKFELKFTMETYIVKFSYSSFNKLKGHTLDNHVQEHAFLKKKIFIKRKTKMLRHSHMTQESGEGLQVGLI